MFTSSIASWLGSPGQIIDIARFSTRTSSSFRYFSRALKKDGCRVRNNRAYTSSIKSGHIPAEELLIFLTALKNTDALTLFSLICSFNVRLLVMVRPSSLALDTLSSSLSSTTIGANRGSSFTKDILSSFHFSLLRWTLFCVDHSVTLYAISRAQLRLPLTTTSDTVISSTYFPTLAKLSTSKSFIITRNGHGPYCFPEGPRRAIILTDRKKFTKPLLHHYIKKSCIKHSCKELL